MDCLESKLNLETARVPFRELGRYFAAGRLIRVAPTLDLIEVATAVANDDTLRVKAWLSAGLMSPARDHEARVWQADDVLLWAVVVKPYVLVQQAAAGA